MPNLQDILSTITGRLGCEEDFTFPKNREDLALAVRSTLAPRISEILGGELCKVSIDGEGDIALEAKSATIYLTKFGGSCSVVRVPLSSLSTSNVVHSLPTMIAGAHQLRSSFLKPLTYGLRIYGSVWSPNPPSIQKLQSAYFSSLRKVVPFERNLLQLTSLTCSYSYAAGEFTDTVDLESGSVEVSLRIARQADANRFADFAEFLNKADIADMVGRISPFLEPIESKFSSLGSLLGSTKTTE